MRYAFFITATPAQSRIRGSTMMPFFSATTFSQSSSLPTMSVQTGPMRLISLPLLLPALQAPLHRLRHGDGLREREAHRGVDADAARRWPPPWPPSPARVAGIFTMTLGASALNRTACSTIAAAFRYSPGSVWMESRPFLPLLALEGRRQQRRGLDGHLLHHPPGDLPVGSVGHLADERRDPVLPERPFLLQHAEDDDGVAGGSHRPVAAGWSQRAPAANTNRSRGPSG